MVEIIAQDIYDTFAYLETGLLSSIFLTMLIVLLRYFHTKSYSMVYALKCMVFIFYLVMLIQIALLSREAGSRTKIAVWSNDPDVDPVGACVGMNGARVNAIVGELRGEKIDIITWNENPAMMIENALSPAKVISVIADAEEKSAKVVVPDYQLSLAIGKEGQNARLAARLTGFKIDIKSETQARESGDFLDYENDYEEDEYYDEDGGSYEEYEDGSAPAEESYETDGAEENNAEADGEDRE